MEPETGASTWALGSQRWTKYIGNFTKKARSKAKLNQAEVLSELSKNIPNIDKDPVECQIIRVAAKRGKDEIKV